MGRHEITDVEELAGHQEGAGHRRHGGAGFFDRPVGVGDPRQVDHFVGDSGADDLPTQRVVVQLLAEPCGHGLREVLVQDLRKPRIVAEPTGEQRVGNVDLDVRGEHGQFRPGEPPPLGDAFFQLVVGREELNRTIEPRGFLEMIHEAGGGRRRGHGAHAFCLQQAVLFPVGLQDEVADGVGLGLDERRPLTGVQQSAGDQAVDHDLDVDLAVGGLDAGRVVDRVRVDQNTLASGLDASELGQAQVAALTDHAGTDIGTVDAEHVVRLVPDLRIRFGRCLDVGADAPVVDQVHRGLEDGRDQVGRGKLGDPLVQPQGLPDLRGQGDGLLGPGEDPAPFGDQGPVVVLPRGARKVVEPLTLGEGRRRVGRRVDEDVPMVESGDQERVFRAQHPVAEDVAGHVTDARGREFLVLAVDAQLREMPLDRFPRPAGGDAHGLVVVAHGTARGERVTEPESVFLRDRVREVRERGGALVGGNHEVGVVAVQCDDALRRHDRFLSVLRGHQVVGDVQERADEETVRGPTLGHPRFAVRRGIGQLLGEESTFGPGRDDDGVLDHLGLDQAEHLGPEVLATIRPAQATAGDVAEAQMYTLDSGRVDPDLVLGPRQRGRRDLLGHELEGDRRTLLVRVGPDGRRHDLRQGSEHLVGVERGHFVQGRLDFLRDLCAPCLALLHGLPRGRIEARLEETHHQACDTGIRQERVGHEGVGQPRPQLDQVPHVRAQHGHRVPRKLLREHQAVQRVGFGAPGEHGAQGVLVELSDVLGVHAGGEGHPEVVQEEVASVRGREVVGLLVDHGQAEILHDRQELGQRLRFAQVRLEAVFLLDAVAVRLRARAADAHSGRALRTGGLEGLEDPGVGDGLGNFVVGTVSDRGGVQPALGDGRARASQGGFEGFGPGAGRVLQLLLELGDVDVRNLVRLGQAQAQEEASEGRRRVLDLEVDRRQVHGLAEDILDADANARVVPVTGQEHDGGDEAPELVGAEEQPGAASFLEPDDPGEGLREGVLIGLEHLEARIVLDHARERLVRVRSRLEAQPVPDHPGPLTHQGGLRGREGVGLEGEQPQDHVFADDAPIRVEVANPDVIQVFVAVDRRPGIRFGHVDDLGIARIVLRETREVLDPVVDRFLGVVVLIGEDAETRARPVGDGQAVGSVLEIAFLVPEEQEIVPGDPVQELLDHLRVFRRIGGVLGILPTGFRQVADPFGEVQDLVAHGFRVGIRMAGVPQNGFHALDDVLRRGFVIAPEQFHRNPGLDRALATGGRPQAGQHGGVTAGHLLLEVQTPQTLDHARLLVPVDQEQGVEQCVRAAVGSSDLCGDRGYEKWHVVGDDHEDPRGSVVDDLDVGAIRFAGLGQFAVQFRPFDQFGLAELGDIVSGCVLIVRGDPGLSVPSVCSVRPLRAGGARGLGFGGIGLLV